ncbi:hypothetical protein B7463_g456, partial [Scytalidium lignicola]
MTDNIMSDDSSELSSVPSEDESDLELTRKDGILKFFSKIPPKSSAPKVEASPPPRKRSPSPPHEYVLADNPDIAFIVMFRSRFAEAFPKSLAHFGPQELERDIVDTVPGELAENLLCALLGLLLNRKQDVKTGHYNRALEEAVQTHRSQWAKDWESKNPLSGGATFTTMSPTERLTLLKTLILCSLSSSEAIRAIITSSYKQTRHEDDLNQPLSVQPWGSDSDKRRYYLIEGLDDTHFRVYREGNYTGINRTWFSVAGDIEELKQLAQKLAEKDGGQKARTLSSKILTAVPRFEATEEKRKRREYRQTRKQQFKRPEHGFSLYEGRTRGKRIKYTYSDDDELYSDATTSRRSTRNTRTHTPAEGLGAPTVTSSGRQVRSRNGGIYGESLLSGAVTPAVSTGDGTSEEPEDNIPNDQNGRPRRSAAVNHGSRGWSRKSHRYAEGYDSADIDDEEDDASEQDYGDDEDEDDRVPARSEDGDQENFSDEVDDLDELDELIDGEKRSLVVKLPVKTPTPERTSTIKHPITPEDASSQPARRSPNTSGDPNKTHIGIHAVNDTVNSSDPLASTRGTFFPVTTKASMASGSPGMVSSPLESPAKPLAIVQKANRSTAPAPLSPSLAFRGSPEKNSTFSRSIDVGSRDS